jgi:hypothetical protein
VHFCGGGDDHGSPEFATQGAEVVFDDDDDVDDYGKGWLLVNACEWGGGGIHNRFGGFGTGLGLEVGSVIMFWSVNASEMYMATGSLFCLG